MLRAPAAVLFCSVALAVAQPSSTKAEVSAPKKEDLAQLRKDGIVDKVTAFAKSLKLPKGVKWAFKTLVIAEGTRRGAPIKGLVQMGQKPVEIQIGANAITGMDGIDTATKLTEVQKTFVHEAEHARHAVEGLPAWEGVKLTSMREESHLARFLSETSAYYEQGLWMRDEGKSDQLSQIVKKHCAKKGKCDKQKEDEMKLDVGSWVLNLPQYGWPPEMKVWLEKKDNKQMKKMLWPKAKGGVRGKKDRSFLDDNASAYKRGNKDEL